MVRYHYVLTIAGASYANYYVYTKVCSPGPYLELTLSLAVLVQCDHGFAPIKFGAPWSRKLDHRLQ